MTDVELTSGNGSVSITTVGRKEDKEDFTCNQYRVQIFRKGKRKTLAAKAAAKDRLDGGDKNKRKDKKVISNPPPLRLHSRGTEEDMPLGSVIL